MAICNATRTLQRYFFQQIVLHVCTPWVEYDAAELHGSPTGRWGVESSIRTLPSAKPTGRREHDGEHGRVHGAAAHRMTHFWGRLPTSDGPAGFFLPHAGFSSVLLLLRLHREPWVSSHGHQLTVLFFFSSERERAKVQGLVIFPHWNERDTIYDISSDFGDRMTTQQLD